MAKVSVVVPVYNAAEHLRACLDSIAGQTCADLEILCVNDGSTDESPAILAEYAARDERFTALTQRNAGPGAARNAGLERASGDYLIFLDSDDWFEPDFLARLTETAERTGADVTIGGAVEFDTQTGRERPSGWMLKTQYLPGEVFSPREISERLFQFTYGWPWDKLYRTGFVRERGLRYPALRNSEDLVFVFESLALAQRIAVVPGRFVHHRVGRESSVSSQREKHPEEPYEAAALVRRRLCEEGMIPLYEKSFQSWAVTFLVWHVNTMRGGEERKRAYAALRRRWLPELGCGMRQALLCGSRQALSKYLLIRALPYPGFAAVTQCHHLMKKAGRSGA